MKKVVLLILLVSTALLAENIKRTFLAPYEPYTAASQEVSAFLNNPENSTEKLHVLVLYTDLHEESSDEIILDDKPNEGLRTIWINGNKISEQDYNEYLRGVVKTPYRIPGFDSVMSYDEIQNLLKSEESVYVDVYKPPFPSHNPAYDSLLLVSRITTNAFAYTYSGNGVGIYFTETGCPDLAEINTSNYSQGYADCSNGVQDHPSGVAKILQSTAPQAFVYGYDQHNYPNPDTVNPVINVGSHSWAVDGLGIYGTEDALMDCYIYMSRVTNFVTAGNRDDPTKTFHVCSPGKSVNAITVGAVNPRNNTYDSYSRWINSNVGNQKPEMANYAEFYFPNALPAYSGDFSGTSAATPYTAAMAADLMSQYNDMKRHPEIVKAYMLVQDGRTIYGGSSYDQDNNTEAALQVPYYNDNPDVSHYTSWNGNNDCCFSGDGSIELTETGIQAGHRYRIAIAWLVPGCYVLQNGYLPQDIDLDVYQGNSLIAYSNSGTDPFEMVDFTAQTAQNLRIVITRFSNSGYGKVALGYAMWHN